MKKRILITLSIAGTALAVAAAAVAATLSATAAVAGTAGVSLNLPTAPTVNATLDGTDQAISYAPKLGIVDARGTGSGWNVTVAATPFTSSTHTFAAGTITSVAQACAAGSTCSAPTNSVSYPLSLSATANKVFSAAANSGMGKVDVTPTIQTSIPGNAYAGNYSSTLTIATALSP
jgi:putative surface cell wall-binding protein